MNTLVKIALFICFSVSIFIAGYLTGSTQFGIGHIERQLASGVSSSSNLEKSSEDNSETNRNDVEKINKSQRLALNGANSHLTSEESSLNFDSRNSLTNAIETSDIISAFDALVAYSQNNNDYSLYGQKMDALRQSLINDESAIADLLLYFQQLPMDSQANYMLISIIMGLPPEIGEPAIQQLLETTLLNETTHSENDFLDLVSRTGVQTPSITDSVINIALFGNSNEATLRALDVLMPYDLSPTEGEQVKERLAQSIEDSTSQQQSYYFSQLLRFSSKLEREALIANEFASDEPNYAIQSNVMNAVQSGVIDRSDKLKQQLTTIAKQANHPLREQASYTLLYRFDLSQAEYQDLVQGQNLDLNRY